MPDLLALRDATAALLQAVPDLDVHVGHVEKVTLDPDGRAHPYAVLWVSTGRQDAQNLAGQPDLLAWSFQVTAAGGDDTRALWAAQRVLDALCGVRLAPTTGLIEHEGDPGPIREDTGVTPSRSYLPLLFSIPAT